MVNEKLSVTVEDDPRADMTKKQPKRFRHSRTCVRVTMESKKEEKPHQVNETTGGFWLQWRVGRRCLNTLRVCGEKSARTNQKNLREPCSVQRLAIKKS